MSGVDGGHSANPELTKPATPESSALSASLAASEPIVPEWMKDAAARFNRTMTAVPMTDTEKLPDPDFEPSALAASEQALRTAQDEAQENWQSVKKWKARAEQAEAERDAIQKERDELRQGLEAIESLLTDEIRERYGPDERQPKGARIYPLLSVPRNMARNALAGASSLLSAEARPVFWQHAIAECNEAHQALDRLGAPKTRMVPRIRGVGDEEITIGLRDRILSIPAMRNLSATLRIDDPLSAEARGRTRGLKDWRKVEDLLRELAESNREYWIKSELHPNVPTEVSHRALMAWQTAHSYLRCRVTEGA